MINATSMITRACQLSNDIAVTVSPSHMYSEYKSELAHKVKLYDMSDLNITVTEVIDSAFRSSVLGMVDVDKETFKADIYEVIVDNNIENEVVLAAITLAMLLKYYNMGMATADRCCDTIYQVCDNMAENIARDICKQV